MRAAPQPSDELIAAIQAAGGLASAAWKLTPELVAELVKEVPAKGDPARGEAIYRNSANQCLKCHAIGGAGGIVGPDMVSLGATAQIDYLLESLIAPAAKARPQGSRPCAIVTAAAPISPPTGSTRPVSIATISACSRL